MTEQNNYNKTIFYKIICKDESINDEYVGHTTNFTQRSLNHKSKCCNPNVKGYNIPLYQFIRENGGFDNFKIVIIEERSFSNRKDAEAHEGYLINILEASLNNNKPGRTKQEYNEQNKEYIRQRKKQYDQDNKEYTIQYTRQYNLENKEHKRQYDLENIEQRKQRISKPFECPCCKSWIQWGARSIHNKSTKHQKAMMATEQ